MVGSDQSFLLSAMLGERHRVRGYVNLNSAVAYVRQQVWIQNMSLRNHNSFGQTLKPDFYKQVTGSCALQPDLDIFTNQDETEIGEKGINLLTCHLLELFTYSQADIYLLDDPLNAVDSNVGRHIFDQVLSKEGLLSDKTRILVTHGVQ